MDLGFVSDQCPHAVTLRTVKPSVTNTPTELRVEVIWIKSYNNNKRFTPDFPNYVPWYTVLIGFPNERVPFK